jgi:hypothetical protein
MEEFNISYILSAFFASVLWVALQKIKKLRRQIDTPQSDPPPACLRCEFYRAVKSEFQHDRNEIQKTDIDKGS